MKTNKTIYSGKKNNNKDIFNLQIQCFKKKLHGGQIKILKLDIKFNQTDY